GAVPVAGVRPRRGGTVATGGVVTGPGTPVAGPPPTGGANSAAAGAGGTVGSRAGVCEAETLAVLTEVSGTCGPVTTWPNAPSPRRPPLSSTTATAAASAPGTTRVTAAAPNPRRR